MAGRGLGTGADARIFAGNRLAAAAGERAKMSIEMLSFLQLVYSFAKQYISWYERTIKARR